MVVDTIWTVGHSTRSLDAFLDCLRDYRIEAIADVRRFPGSRRYPQFARDALAVTLSVEGIEYEWLPKLGGRRNPSPTRPTRDGETHRFAVMRTTLQY